MAKAATSATRYRAPRSPCPCQRAGGTAANHTPASSQQLHLVRLGRGKAAERRSAAVRGACGCALARVAAHRRALCRWRLSRALQARILR